MDAIKQIFKDLEFTEEELLFIEKRSSKLALKKGDELLSKGDLTLSQFYVLEGCLRSYFIDSHEKDHTVQFAIHDWWISDYTAFFDSSMAVLTIESLQNTTVLEFTRAAQQEIFDEIPKVERFFREKMEHSFGAFQKRIINNLSKTAKDKYNDFLQTHAQIEKHIKNYHIASYLGITTESLSRIRREIARG
ncbi:Crp/Fnr family transcriptional regulator [Flammeovirga kamogawensis]|uniref:Crp/Fnr family transcriptional regulator n=1 Tax=Flammeovirga kamogawensis TaxID=373891 RepID=A0ABX8GR09_9BACT|nr:Crp/Fnr family transcriptional regulator [Flammeovirga kamogawensis]MBB6463082.1 CRP-like cAMP-binding protein [Flammeovirga kamogawensis]QWG05717.1 Crp/Fnr family transcriptional regulator [Flammeovirga kamogawensis]TRX67546.1 Crp/Fnr family transcriptional regulator [Flammeovirga kamogawensis]